ncbi:phytoene/squalene synthase family protein [Candidatus Nanosalina sp. VS9-1]|uniref:phytoene/squalene synthase family protein n=1 Tax=Candidatus Nanosalina sp. VS9-1 TaxID=3388566 RepID=UPI0039DF918B
MDEELKEIFSENSTSYYYSSLVFPKNIREDVFKLYAYVRTADDFVDEKPQNAEALKEFREETFDNWESGESEDRIVNVFLEVAREKNFEKEWVEAFLDSMAADLDKEEYETLDETLEYIHGSAEVIGLMMCAILGLDEEAYRSAEMLGRSMQYCNFIRDIKEDNELGRQYLPTEEIEKHGLEGLEEDEVEKEKFEAFMENQLEKYWEWQREAEKGLKHLPYRIRVPVILSSRLYKYTAKKIEKDPMIVYREKVRPSKPRIFYELLASLKGRK